MQDAPQAQFNIVKFKADNYPSILQHWTEKFQGHSGNMQFKIFKICRKIQRGNFLEQWTI